MEPGAGRRAARGAIRHAVEQYFGRAPAADINPDEVVALGAAIHAASLASDSSDTYLLDVTPLSLRLGIAGGLTEPIIERNSPVPIDVSRLFNPVRDAQETVTVRIYQGEARAAEDNELLGEFEFSGYEPGPREAVQIEVTCEISTEGIVKVSAADPKTGVAHSTTVSMSSGLSEAEIEAIIARGRAEDAEQESKGGGGSRASSRKAVADFVAQNHDSVDLPEEDDLLLGLPDLSADLPDPPDEAGDREQFGDLAEDLTGSDDDLA